MLFVENLCKKSRIFFLLLCMLCLTRWLSKELIVNVFDGVTDLLLATCDTEVLLNVTDLPATVGLDALGVEVDVTSCDKEIP